MTEYGNGGNFTVVMEGPYAGGSIGGTDLKMTNIQAPAANWKGAESPYSQVIAVDGIDVNTKVDIDLSADQLQYFLDNDKDIAFTAENEGGVITLFAIGNHPGIDLEFQATLTGVVNI